jgi:hypothetical protein
VGRELNILALVKEEQRFVYVYDDDSAEYLLATLEEHAENPGMSLNWYDVSVLSQKVAEQLELNRQGTDSPRLSPDS